MNVPHRKLIYSESQTTFFNDILLNQVADKMRIASNTVQNNEFRAWENSTKSIKNLIELSGLEDIYITFEYLVPYTQRRIDCLLYGSNKDNKGVVVHIELKQWDNVKATNIEGNFVETYTGKPQNLVAHPSQQVKGYHEYLVGFVEIFEENDVELYGCSYCHNYTRVDGEGLYDQEYKKILDDYPVYSKNDVKELAETLREKLGNGDGYSIFNKFMQSPVRPSKKLLESASKIINDTAKFALLNDQIVARNAIVSKIKNADKNNEKSVIIIKGGPGTGKTVIALHLLAELASSQKQRSVFFATKSKPLLEGIKHNLERGNQAKLLFTNLNQYIPSRVAENSVDVLLIDEAHRIGKTSNNQYTKAFDRTELPQIETLIKASKVSIFFIDDKQIIREQEIGNTDLIKETASNYNCSIKEVELISQFRCNGSDNYLDWLESTLGHNDSKRILKEQDNYEFKIFDSPTDLYTELIKKNEEKDTTARLTAGFCWPWSKTLDEEGNLKNDVQIGSFAMPWETHGDITRPPKGFVKWYEWAYKPEGIKQVGCIYTAQGFEFDYIGVIVGEDLKYNEETDTLKGDITATQDPTLRRGKENFEEYVKNIYRVLMSRGMKGCYVYFTNKETEKYFRSRLEIV
nr:DNA/RNA helicase domain-containing protein [uncultured Chryseobacterium sp.]